MVLRLVRKKLSFYTKELRNIYLRVMGVDVGNNVFVSSSAWIDTARGKVIIGNGVKVTRGCVVLSHDHTAWQLNSGQKVEGVTTIQNNVFIGVNSVILPGVTIGEGAFVGAGCVISKDVEPYTVVVANGVRTIKRKNLQTKEWEKVT